MPYQTLIIDRKGPIMGVRLNRPDAANALNTSMALDLKVFLKNLPVTCRAVVITGQGKHFCAGADLKERRGMDEKAWHTQHKAFEEAFSALRACEVPVIAAVNGAAMGGGLELALACDFIYAATSARFALTEATLGILPGLGGTQTLPCAIGTRRAKEAIFTGKPFSAEEAYGWGMVNKLCPPESLVEEAFACAETIATNAPLSIKAAKKAVEQGIALPVERALAVELKYYNKLLASRDRHEGINAFNEKRKPDFIGE